MSNLDNLQEEMRLLIKQQGVVKGLFDTVDTENRMIKEHNESLTAKLTNAKIVSEARLNTMNTLKERNLTLNNKIETQSLTIRSNQENLEAKDRRILDLSRQIERMKNETKEVTNLLLKTELKEKNAKILSLIESNQELHERNQALTTHNETLADCVDASNNKISSQNDIINSNIEAFKRKNNIISELNKKVHSLTRDVSRQKKLIKGNKSRIEFLETTLSRKRNQYRESLKAIDTLKGEYKQVVERNNIQYSKIQELRNELNNSNLAFGDLTIESRKLKVEFDNLDSRKERLSKSLTESNNLLKEYREENKQLLERNNNQYDIIQDLKKDVEKLEQKERVLIARDVSLHKSVLTHPFKHTSQVRRLLEQGKSWEVKAGKRLKHIEELVRLIDNKNKYILELKFPHKQDRELGSTLRELEKGGYI